MSNLDDSKPSGLKSKPQGDSLTFALAAVDDRWSLHIVRALAFGAARYTAILRAVGSPRDVLAARLRSLTDAGVVRAVPGEGRPAGYELTSKGRDLAQVILVLKKWGDLYGDPYMQRLEIFHDDCGHEFVAELHCRACGRALVPGSLSTAAETEAPGRLDVNL